MLNTHNELGVASKKPKDEERKEGEREMVNTSRYEIQFPGGRQVRPWIQCEMDSHNLRFLNEFQKKRERFVKNGMMKNNLNREPK